MNLPWAELLLGSLRDAGAGDLVISPGSRSTPLVLAAARLGLSCHVLLDERVAGFTALGRARVTGRPSVLVCTSGTAAAHYLPAVIEAAMARVPLIVVTADRPPELRDCGAPQTIDQAHLFGRFARGFCDLGVPEAVAGALRGVRRRAAQMVALSRAPDPGPVHINAPARLPLEPSIDPGPEERRMIELAASIAAEPITRAAPSPNRADDAAIAEVVEACRAATRGLIVAGPAPFSGSLPSPCPVLTPELASVDLSEPRSQGCAPSAPSRSISTGNPADFVGTPSDPEAAVTALARATGFPVLAELTSQVRGVPGQIDPFDLTVRAARRGDAAEAPDLVIELGAPATSGAWSRTLAAARGVRRVVIAPHGWLDPHGSAWLLLQGEPGDAAARIADRLAAGAPTDLGRREAWREAWRDAGRRARAALDRTIDERAGAGLGEHAAVRAALAALPGDALLVLGNSLPVRVADAVAPARRLDVLHQRGAAGIDGLIAGAAGAASAARRPTAVLLGDVSFAHDLGGLGAARAAGAPVAIVVVDNGGGRIFEHLPVASAPGGAEALERFYVTAPDLDLAAAAAAFRIGYRRADDAAGVAEAVRAALSGHGATVVHLVVAPHSAVEVERAAAALLAEAP